MYALETRNIPMSKNAVAIEDVVRSNAIIVPGYTFDTRAQSDAYRAIPENPSVIFVNRRPFFTNHLPKDIDLSDCFLGSVLGKVGRILGYANTEAPEGSHHQLLLIGGKRSFYRDVPAGRVNRLISYMLQGMRNAYVEFGDRTGAELPLSGEVEGTRIYRARSGRMAIVFQEPIYSKDLKETGMRTWIRLSELRIYDRNPERHSQVLVNSVYTAQLTRMLVREELSGLDDGWFALAERAMAGFRATCQTVDLERELWRKRFVQQRHLESVDGSKAHGQRYIDSLTGLTCDEALKTVKEAWQMRHVFDRYCTSEFDESPHRCSPASERCNNMLARHNCTHERRLELRKMIEDYTQPLHYGWNYTGD